jgi:hypothetical protein
MARGRAVGLVLVAPLAAWIGCSPPALTRAPLSQLAARATFDLECPTEWLRLTNIDDGVKGVDGCGRRATYVEICRDVDSVCVWWTNPATMPPDAQPAAAHAQAYGTPMRTGPTLSDVPPTLGTARTNPLLDRQ